jgi:hypothetical protein
MRDYDGEPVILQFQIGELHYAFYGTLDTLSKPLDFKIDVDNPNDPFDVEMGIRPMLPPQTFDVTLSFRYRRDNELPNAGTLTDFGKRARRTLKMLKKARKRAKKRNR